MSELTWGQALIVSFIPLAQLYARIVWLNGSLDKSWLLIPIFWIFPFSFVPGMMMKFGYIAPGRGGKPYDMWMYLPIIAKVFLSILIPPIMSVICEEDARDWAVALFSLFLQLIVNMVPFMIKRPDFCNSDFTMKSFGKAFVDGTIANGFGELMPYFFMGMSFIPYIGLLFDVIGMLGEIPFLGEAFIWGLGFVPAYIFINMVNGDKLEEYCASGYLGKDLSDRIFFFLTLILSMALKIVGEMDLGGDMDDFD